MTFLLIQLSDHICLNTSNPSRDIVPLIFLKATPFPFDCLHIANSREKNYMHRRKSWRKIIAEGDKNSFTDLGGLMYSENNLFLFCSYFSFLSELFPSELPSSHYVSWDSPSILDNIWACSSFHGIWGLNPPHPLVHCVLCPSFFLAILICLIDCCKCGEGGRG